MRIRARHMAGVLPVLALAVALASGPVMANAGTFRATTGPVQNTTLGSGLNVHGSATLTLMGVNLRAHITASGLSPNLRHLMHIHGVIGAQNDCPNISDDPTPDLNGDGFVDTAEGQPKYGPILVTFSTSGSTSAAAGLNLSTAVVASASGTIDYTRTFKIPKAVAKDLGDLHVVIHGADLDDSGVYDGVVGSLGAGIPLEAELPVSCGAID
ncbi:MAG: hypothetical protein LH650_11045 [Chloroflexi bacterium]|nr:hypothetical protein [Chloroflexota bacterium]